MSASLSRIHSIRSKGLLDSDGSAPPSDLYPDKTLQIGGGPVESPFASTENPKKFEPTISDPSSSTDVSTVLEPNADESPQIFNNNCKYNPVMIILALVVIVSILK